MMQFGVCLMILTIIFKDQALVTGSCNFGPGCTFPCHCQGGELDCNEDGTCENGTCATNTPPGFDWRGPGCQIGNVARGKQTRQSGTFTQGNFERHSGLAVDGRRFEDHTGGSKNHQCTHTSSVPAWWYVDLGSLHVIYNVTVFNQESAHTRLSNFTVGVGNSTDVTKGSKCGYYSGTVPQAGNATITCNKVMLGRYVGLKLKTSGYLSLCEAVVEGYKYSDCDIGTFGAKCFICGKCAKGDICDDTTKKCPNGCQKWYIGDTCKTELRDPGDSDIVESPSQTNDSITIKWKQYDGVPAGGEGFYSYDLMYRRIHGDITVGLEKLPHVKGQINQTATVTGLQPGTEYEFWVKPYREWQNEREPGQDSDISTFRTKDEPTTTTPTTTTSNTITTSQSTESTEPTTETPTSATSKPTPVTTTPPTTTKPTITTTTTTTTAPRSTTKTTQRTTTKLTTVTMLSTYSKPTTQSEIESITSPNNPQSSKHSTESTSSTLPMGTPTKNTQLTGTDKSTQEDSGAMSSIAAGAGGGVGFILLIVIVVIIIVIIIRRRRKTSAPKENQYTEVSNNRSNGTAEYVNVNETAAVTPSTSTQVPEAQYANVNIQQNGAKKKQELEHNGPQDGAVYAEVQKKPPKKTNGLKVSELEDFIEEKLKEKDGFKNEYLTIPSGPTKSWDYGNIEQNKTKNRFLNIRAYDHSRVVLEKDEGDEFSDYINASYITGYNNIDKAYIASQGPKPKTIKDFWKMIWQVKANRIVMVTNLVEKAKVKCSQYWPENVGETINAGLFTVKSTSTEKLTHFTTTVLSVKKGKESFRVRHFHYTAWPDHDVPDYATSLLEFRHRIRSFDNEARGPLVIHCSAGVGRTGTFIAIDHSIEKAEMEGEVDILGCTRAMREERINMIQTEAQYIFVYKAVLEATEFGDTTIKCSRIEDAIRKLSTKDPALKMTPMEYQFQILEKYRLQVKGKNLAGLQPLNETKNRDPQIIPGNSLRPMLGEPLPTVEGGTNYINATYADGYEKADAYILTQMPLPHTIPDLWRLMFDHKLKTIVMLNDMDPNDESCQPYWPEDDSPLQFGPLKVELVNTENDDSGNISTKELKISKEGAECLTVKQFHLCTWKTTRTVPDPTSFLVLMDIVQSWQQQTKNRPTVIHCMNGSERSGMYCVANYILEQLKINRDFNIYSAIKLMRVARPQIITSLEQYQFLHNFAVEYIQQNDAYANFKM